MSTDRIQKKVLLHTSRERAWRALADSTEFGQWFGIKFDGPFRPGGADAGRHCGHHSECEVAKAQKQHEGLAFDITIERMEPECLFSFRWHPNAVERGFDYSAEATTVVEFALEEVAEGVMLTVTESGFDQIPMARRAKAFTANEQGWETMVRVIEEYLVQTP